MLKFMFLQDTGFTQYGIWDVTLNSLVKMYRRFRGAYCDYH
jgi:hypothetical protein